MSPLSAPALALQAPACFPQCDPESCENDQSDSPSFLDNIFLMAAPKKRRTIEVNRSRRRNVRKLEKVKVLVIKNWVTVRYLQQQARMILATLSPFLPPLSQAPQKPSNVPNYICCE